MAGVRLVVAATGGRQQATVIRNLAVGHVDVQLVAYEPERGLVALALNPSSLLDIVQAHRRRSSSHQFVAGSWSPGRLLYGKLERSLRSFHESPACFSFVSRIALGRSEHALSPQSRARLLADLDGRRVSEQLVRPTSRSRWVFQIERFVHSRWTQLRVRERPAKDAREDRLARHLTPSLPGRLRSCRSDHVGAAQSVQQHATWRYGMICRPPWEKHREVPAPVGLRTRPWADVPRHSELPDRGNQSLLRNTDDLQGGAPTARAFRRSSRTARHAGSNCGNRRPCWIELPAGTAAERRRTAQGDLIS